MTDLQFKTIYDTYKNNNFDLCYNYYLVEAPIKGHPVISQAQFQEMFQIWIMMSNMGDVVSGLNNGVESLKVKHKL
jgi:hypothetical protein